MSSFFQYRHFLLRQIPNTINVISRKIPHTWADKSLQYRQGSSTPQLPGSAYNYRSDALLKQIAHMACAIQEVFPPSLKLIFDMTLIIPHWRDVQMRNVCTTIRQERIIGCIWLATCSQLWKSAGSAPDTTHPIDANAPLNYSQGVATCVFCDGHRRDTPEQVKRQPVCINDDGSVLDGNESRIGI